MKRPIAMILIGVLVAPHASAAQKQGKPIDWQRVETLNAGDEIVLTVTGGQPTKVRFLFADEEILVTLKPNAPKLPGGAKEILFGLGPRWPAIFTGLTVNYDRVRVSQAGIFDRDKKLAELSEVVQQTSRADVREIVGPPSHRLGNVLILTAIGVGVFFIIAVLTSGSESGLFY